MRTKNDCCIRLDVIKLLVLKIDFENTLLGVLSRCCRYSWSVHAKFSEFKFLSDDKIARSKAFYQR